MVSRKINLCFVFPAEKSWTGGVNYYVALISSLTSLKKKNFNFIIFCSSKDKIYLSKYINKKNIIASNFFDNKSIFGFFRRLLKIIFQEDVILNFFIKINNINVISHHDPNKKIASICWIPDLQHKFLKYLFSCYSKGIQGDTGLKGLNGDKGTKGTIGIIGDKGLNGLMGNKGLIGPSGNKVKYPF